MPTITIIFNQPLFWKASEIVNAVPDDNPIRNAVFLLLPYFHEFVVSNWNFAGDPGYGEHAMNRTAMQRAIRGPLLVDQWLKPWRMTLLFKTRGSFHKANLATIDLSYLRLILWLPALIFTRVPRNNFKTIVNQLTSKKNNSVSSNRITTVPILSS